MLFVVRNYICFVVRAIVLYLHFQVSHLTRSPDSMLLIFDFLHLFFYLNKSNSVFSII